MGRTAKRLAVLVVCLAVAVIAGSSPAAAGWPVIGTLKVWAGGIPARLGAGGTLDLTINYSQDSPDTMRPGAFGVNVWNTNDPSADLGRDAFTASYLNPLTQQWQEATSSAGDGDRILDISSQPGLQVLPNTTASVRVKITFGSSARVGTYRLQAMVPSIQLITSDGVSDAAILNYHWPHYDFRYGSVAAPAPPVATHPASGTRTPAPASAAQPVPSASSNGSAAAVPTAGPTVSTSSVDPMVATVPVAALEPRALSVWPYLGGVVTIAFLASLGYGLRRRGTKGSTFPAAETVSDVDSGGQPVQETAR